MKRDIVWTTKFKKDYKLAMKRHMDIGLLDDIIRALSRGEKLPEKNKDHELTGDWVGHRECHIQAGLAAHLPHRGRCAGAERWPAPGRTATCSINESAAAVWGNLYGGFSVCKGCHET